MFTGPYVAGQKANTRANNCISPCPRLCHLVEGVSQKPFMCKVNCDTLRFSGTQWDNVDPATDQMHTPMVSTMGVLHVTLETVAKSPRGLARLANSKKLQEIGKILG